MDQHEDNVDAAMLNELLPPNFIANFPWSTPHLQGFQKIDSSSGSQNFNEFDEYFNTLIYGYRQSETVNPFVPESSTPALHSSTLAPPMTIQNQREHQPSHQLSLVRSVLIEILSQPRPEFRPRTEKEYRESTHNIRCAKGSRNDYPTIKIHANWPIGKTIIRVTLVDVSDSHEPHLYTIDSKLREGSSLLFKMNEEAHTLYFYVTKEEHQKGEKTFYIEHIKNGQGDEITKETIKTRKLNQSQLRFTMLYQMTDGEYQADESTTVYSNIMTEKYGNFGITDVFPRYGPMCGNEKVCIETKGVLPNDLEANLIVKVTSNDYHWTCPKSSLQKRGKNFYFHMPMYPDTEVERAAMVIHIECYQEPSFSTEFTYLRCLDMEFNGNRSNELPLADTITGLLPVGPPTVMRSKTHAVKRLYQ